VGGTYQIILRICN